MTIDELLTENNMRMSELSRRYKIPYNTLQHWRIGDRQPPEYLIPILEKAIKYDKGNG